MNDQAPRWLPDGHSQTIWSALYARAWSGERPRFVRTRWESPDGDFVDVDWLQDSATAQPGQQALLVLFHGLEGSSSSHYALSFADQARSLGWAYAVPMFRGCSGEPNRMARAYHSGDWHEIDWLLQRLHAWKRAHLGERAPLYVAGISLGGNAVLRWAQQLGAGARDYVAALAAISAPLDLAACGHALHRGFNRMSYERMFLASMKRKARIKAGQYPGLFNQQRVARARSLFEFDDAFTAPLHGFAGAADYWRRASSRPHLQQLQVPTLLLNARNDPFVPAGSLPRREDVAACVTLWQPAQGGHAGFVQGRWPGQVTGLPRDVTGWMQSVMQQNMDSLLIQEQKHG